MPSGADLITAPTNALEVSMRRTGILALGAALLVAGLATTEASAIGVNGLRVAPGVAHAVTWDKKHGSWWDHHHKKKHHKHRKWRWYKKKHHH
jgi:hypothetical protein